MDRTYIFGEPSGGTGANNGLLASILPSLQNRGIDTGYLMGLLGNGNGNGGFFGNNGGFQDIIALIVIAAIFGNGNFGFGGNNNQGANEGREMIMQTLNRNGVDIAALAQAVNTSSDQILAGINSVSQAICGLGNQMGQNTNSIITAIMQGNNTLASSIANCCCDLKTLISGLGTGMERGFSTIAYETQRQTCDITKSIESSTAQILAGQRAAEMREMQNKIDKLREENSTYKSSAMTSQIVAQATAPLGEVLKDLSARLAKIECNQPEVAKVPYSPVVGVPTCVAAQYGFGFGLNSWNGFNGWG